MSVIASAKTLKSFTTVASDFAYPGLQARQVTTDTVDESAYGDDRSEFDNIIDLILAQKEKIAVCCDKVDRLSRNVFDKRISLLYEKALSDEIELHFVSDGQATLPNNTTNGG